MDSGISHSSFLVMPFSYWFFSLNSIISGPLVSPAGGYDVPTEIMWLFTVSILRM